MGRRVVFDLHEDFPAQLGGKAWMPRPLRRPASWAAQVLLWIAERIIEVTLAEPGYAGRLRNPHPMFPNHLADLAVPVVPPAERGGVVYLGDITVVRGLEVAVEALCHVASRPPLTLIGRCAPELRTRLEEIARTGGVSLTFTGFLPPADALSTMSRHAVAISPWLDAPNYRDSMPTKLLEYLALGLPVVASDLPGSRKMVEGLAGVVWVPPSDPVALGEAIERVLHDPEITATAISGADDVRRRFRWPTDDVRRFYVGDR
jgi:glycosyltransferase involved in cell wall biosynthesis